MYGGLFALGLTTICTQHFSLMHGISAIEMMNVSLHECEAMLRTNDNIYDIIQVYMWHNWLVRSKRLKLFVCFIYTAGHYIHK